MIRLEPLPNAQAHLISGAGVKPDAFLFSKTCQQIIVFPIRLANSGRQTVLLATGESLSQIVGYARLYRGLQYNETEERIQDELHYNPPSEADESLPAEAASYTVKVTLDERLFDQIIALSQTIGLPIIDLQFKLLTDSCSVIYGDAPDGSEVFWGNVPKRWESIEGITFTHALTGRE